MVWIRLYGVPFGALLFCNLLLYEQALWTSVELLYSVVGIV